MDADDINLPREIAIALNEFSHAVESRQWRRLPPASAGAGGAETDTDSSYPGQIARLTELLQSEDPGGKVRDVAHDLFPGEFWEEQGVARVRAREELEVAARDGCCAYLLRPVDLEIAARGKKQVVTAVRHGPPLWPAFVIPGWDWQTHNSLWIARNAIQVESPFLARIAERSLLSHRFCRTVSVGIDASDTGPLPRSILSWAAAEAVARWNRVAEGITELRLVGGQARPDLLIRAHTRPSVSGYGGLFRPREGLGRHRDRARLGIVELVSAGSAAPAALPNGPEEMRYTIEHELGHFYRFDDCVHRWGVTGAHGWSWPYPRPGRRERYALQRRFGLAHCYAKRLARLQHGRKPVRGGIAPSLPSARPLDDEAECEAPVPRFGGPEAAWMEAIWQGERFTTVRQYDEAAACFVAALERSPAEAALRLGTLSFWQDDPDACIRWLERAQQEAPPWWREQREWLHAMLAEAYRLLGDEAAARRHQAWVERHAADRELLYWWCALRAHPRLEFRRPWRVLRAALHSVNAAIHCR
jgi:hypothetical protein